MKLKSVFWFFYGILVILGAVRFHSNYFSNVTPNLQTKIDADIDLPFTNNKLQNLQVYYSVNGKDFELFVDDIQRLKIRVKGKKIDCIPTSPVWKPPVGTSPCIESGIFFNYSPVTGLRSAEEVYTQKINHTLPVICLETEQDNLFGYSKGIYIRGQQELSHQSFDLNRKWWDEPANYHQRGKDWRHKASILILEGDKRIFSSTVWISVHGNATRAFPQKSLRVTALKKKKVNFNIGSLSFRDGKSFIIRNSGNDWGKTMFQDMIIHRLAHSAGCNVHVQMGQPSVLYVNGVFWGIHNIRHRLDKNELAVRCNTSKNNIRILEGYQISAGPPDTYTSFGAFVRYIEKSNIPKRTLELAEKYLHLNNFIDYSCLQLYFANTDWPQNNVKLFKIPGHSDTNLRKWNYVLWDMDYCMANTGTDNVNSNMFDHIRRTRSDFSRIFLKLWSVKEFRNRLMMRMKYLLENGLSEKVILDEIKRARLSINEEMTRHINRWRKPSSMDRWNEEITEMKRFVGKRKKILLNFLKAEKN